MVSNDRPTHLDAMYFCGADNVMPNDKRLFANSVTQMKWWFNASDKKWIQWLIMLVQMSNKWAKENKTILSSEKFTNYLDEKCVLHICTCLFWNFNEFNTNTITLNVKFIAPNTICSGIMCGNCACNTKINKPCEWLIEPWVDGVKLGDGSLNFAEIYGKFDTDSKLIYSICSMYSCSVICIGGHQMLIKFDRIIWQLCRCNCLFSISCR